MKQIDLFKPKSIEINPVFARHETFHPRFGWFKKGYDKIVQDPGIFAKETAPTVLGVGKNMVKAIKYWCIAFKIIEEEKIKGKKSLFFPSVIASKLLADEGWDPYLENPASLWLLHWQLFRTPCDAPVWFFVFNQFNKYEFTFGDLLAQSRELKDQIFPSKKTTDSSLSKDINCLLRMYVKRNGSKKLKEDSLDCPFTELGIISEIGGSKKFTFNFGDKSNLKPEIVVAACLDFASLMDTSAKTISISRLLYDAGSPGSIFKLNEGSLCEAIEQVSIKNKKIALTDSAGLIQLAFSEDPSLLSESILNNYYKKGI